MNLIIKYSPAWCLALVLALPAWAQQHNPALRDQPQLDDPALVADQERLNAMHTATVAHIDTLTQYGSPVCELTEAMTWLLNRRMTSAEYADSMAALPDGMQSRVTHLETVMTHGDCVNGVPVGEFTARGRFDTESSYVGITSTTQESIRVRGTVVNGQLQGEVTTSGRTIGRQSDGSLSYDNIVHTITRFDAGQPVGRGMGLTFSTSAEGNQQVVTNVQEYLGPGTIKILTWMGSMLATEMTTVDGKADGWLINHPIEVMRGYRTELTRTCYQRGQIAGEAVCVPVGEAIADAVSGYPRPTFRRNPERDMMAALTTHSQRALPGTREAFEGAASLCPVSEASLWAIAYGSQADRIRAAGVVNRIEGKLLDGQCVNGHIEGPFHVLLFIDTGNPSVVSAAGTLRNGKRHGRLLSARTTYQDNQSVSFGIADYEDNRLVSPRINFLGITTLLEKPTCEPEVLDVERFNGRDRAENYRTVNGVRHGMSISYHMAGDRIRRCYQNGRRVDNLRTCR